MDFDELPHAVRKTIERHKYPHLSESERQHIIAQEKASELPQWQPDSPHPEDRKE